jgi:hypothetical protein
MDQSQSQSNLATDGQSCSKSLCRAPSGAHDQIFVTLWQLPSCFSEAPSLTRGRVCLLCMLLALASIVFLWFESHWTRDHILLSQIWDFSFVDSYDSQGHGGGIRTRLHTSGLLTAFSRPGRWLSWIWILYVIKFMYSGPSQINSTLLPLQKLNWNSGNNGIVVRIQGKPLITF